MVSTGTNYTKLKTNLRLSINRLKLLEKKKTELALKARKEIADYISIGKFERAKIRVEHIIREDYLVEAMELVEMFCDLLLARFGLIQQMKTLDEGLAESISSLIWVAPRLQADCPELKIISDLFTYKYGKQYAQAARDNALNTVSEKLMHKLSVQAPPKKLVEMYLIEIAKSHNIPYEPDPELMKEEEVFSADEAMAGGVPEKPSLIDFGEFGGVGGIDAPPLPSKGPNTAFPPDTIIGFNTNPGMMPPLPIPFDPNNFKPPQPPNNFPSGGSGGGGGGEKTGSYPGAQFGYPTGATGGYPPGPPGAASAPPPSTNFPSDPSGAVGGSLPTNSGPPPNYESVVNDPKNRPTPLPRAANPKTSPDAFPELPEVPSFSPTSEDHEKNDNDSKDETIDFEDLAKRFEALKKRK